METMKKALFFDIDGTLYDFHGIMPDSTRRALRKAKEAGHQLVICSGRSVFQIYPQLMKDFDGVVCSTGAMVQKNGRIIYEHYMPKETLSRVREVFREAGGYVAAMTEEHLKLDAACRDYLRQRFAGRFGQQIIRQVMGDYEVTDDLTGCSDIKKILFYESDQSVQQIQKALEDCCDVTGSSFENPKDDSGEITVKGINKALGIRKYIEDQGIRLEDTVAFGDGPNDLDMMEYAGIGVAMGNGSAALKAKADFVTKDIAEDGIEYALKTLEIIA